MARRSVGGLGSSSDGGSGGPVWAQLASRRQSAVGAMNFPGCSVMRKGKEYQRERERGVHTSPAWTGQRPVTTQTLSRQVAHGFAKDFAVAVNILGLGCRRHQRHVVE